jgi:DnaJ-class molecular chaperone
MNLTQKEREVIERMREAERKKRGTVPCYDCDGTGSYSQCDCDTCGGTGELKRNGPEIQSRVRLLQGERKTAIAAFDKKIAAARGHK